MVADAGSLGAVVFAGAVAGAFAATMIPYWQKLRETPELIFDKKFLGTAIWSIGTSLGMGFWLFTSLLDSAQKLASISSLGAIFIITATAAFGINMGTNKFITSVTPPTTTKPTDPSSSEIIKT